VTTAYVSYAGPACPHCRRPLPPDELSDGLTRCTICLTEFEARRFDPPQRGTRVLQIAESGPEAPTACANHTRNVATATCDRCGLLICSLCQLDIGTAKYCPSCFDRVTQDGTLDVLKNRLRDYGSLSLVWGFGGLVFSFFFLSIPLGGLALYYCYRALRSRENRSSLVSVFIGIGVALIDIAIGLFYIYSLFFAATRGVR